MPDESVEICRLRALLAAVMERAILDLDFPLNGIDNTNEGYSRIMRTLVEREKARNWFKKNDYRFNQFLGICALLELNPAVVRERYKDKIYCTENIVGMRIVRKNEFSDYPKPRKVIQHLHFEASNEG
jgi:hypothetical protein